MSAFSVSTAHLNYLVTAAYLYKCLGPVGGRQSVYDAATERLKMLRAENNASLAARYPTNPDTQTHGRESATLTGVDKINPVQVLKAIACYAYQACEHDAWETSEARAFCEQLKAHAIANLPGYREAAWEVT